jgi:NTP pyrophosphatase (non-canonical NTP hydrolase)
MSLGKAYDRVLEYVDVLIDSSQAGDVRAKRYYLMAKLQEEIGEYAEMLNARYFLTQRKRSKLAEKMEGNDNPNTLQLIQHADQKRKQEAGDVLWIAMAIAVLEGYTLEDIADYFINHQK